MRFQTNLKIWACSRLQATWKSKWLLSRCNAAGGGRQHGRQHSNKGGRGWTIGLKMRQEAAQHPLDPSRGASHFHGQLPSLGALTCSPQVPQVYAARIRGRQNPLKIPPSPGYNGRVQHRLLGWASPESPTGVADTSPSIPLKAKRARSPIYRCSACLCPTRFHTLSGHSPYLVQEPGGQCPGVLFGGRG